MNSPPSPIRSAAPARPLPRPPRIILSTAARPLLSPTAINRRSTRASSPISPRAAGPRSAAVPNADLEQRWRGADPAAAPPPSPPLRLHRHRRLDPRPHPRRPSLPPPASSVSSSSTDTYQRVAHRLPCHAASRAWVCLSSSSFESWMADGAFLACLAFLHLAFLFLTVVAEDTGPPA
ncbi:hypothetical protein BS78_01G349700 [Paspalum vaginatum]|nr:hypothetical protein BS78_01G349700 [Paspalum vaginatum]